ncbi:MAG: hypothetical protein NT040_07795 [Bacteroidetes bacterium]|nr:hypothetical protein [Bacteroidota bacterium]
MKQKQILSIAVIMLMICFGCKKSTESPDYATTTTGLYSGYWVVPGLGQVSGTCKVVKVTSTAVNLIGTAGGQSMPTIPSVKLSDGSNGKIILTYSDASGTLSGLYDNNTLTMTLISGATQTTFSGTK